MCNHSLSLISYLNSVKFEIAFFKINSNRSLNNADKFDKNLANYFYQIYILREINDKCLEKSVNCL